MLHSYNQNVLTVGEYYENGDNAEQRIPHGLVFAAI